MNSRPARSTCERPSEGEVMIGCLEQIAGRMSVMSVTISFGRARGLGGLPCPARPDAHYPEVQLCFSLRFAPKGTMGPHTLRELLRRQCCSTRFHVCFVLYWIVVVQGCSRVSCTKVCGTSGGMHVSLFDEAQFNGWACPLSKRPARDREETLIYNLWWLILIKASGLSYPAIHLPSFCLRRSLDFPDVHCDQFDRYANGPRMWWNMVMQLALEWRSFMDQSASLGRRVATDCG